MKTFIVAATALACLSTQAWSASKPWPGDRWLATIAETAKGHRKTTFLRGNDKHESSGVKVDVVCIDRNLDNGAITRVAGKGKALVVKGEFKGDVDGVGTFGIDSPAGGKINWSSNPSSACAAGAVSWNAVP